MSTESSAAFFIEAELHAIPARLRLEIGAPARGRRHGNNFSDRCVVKISLGKRGHHLPALPGEIETVRYVLKCAAAANTEMPTWRRYARGASHQDLQHAAALALPGNAHHIARHGVRHEEAIGRYAIATMRETHDFGTLAFCGIFVQAIISAAASLSRPKAPSAAATMALASRPAASYIFSGVS